MPLIAVVLVALLLSACVTGYSREAPMGAYPAGDLSGPPTHFVGVKLKFAAPPKRSPVE